MVEQLTLNQRAQSSSLCAPTKKKQTSVCFFLRRKPEARTREARRIGKKQIALLFSLPAQHHLIKTRFASVNRSFYLDAVARSIDFYQCVPLRAHQKKADIRLLFFKGGSRRLERVKQAHWKKLALLSDNCPFLP